MSAETFKTLEMILSEKQALHSPEAAIANAAECSPFLHRLLHQNAELLADLLLNVHQPYTNLMMQDWLQKKNIFDEASLKSTLRQLRQRIIARLIVRDLAGYADLNEVMLTTSHLAEVALSTGVCYISTWMSEQFGSPEPSLIDPTKPQSLMVIGMGKLGGYELNVSSDIDLIYVYEASGTTTGTRAISHQEFFTKVAKQLITVIDEVTQDGFVFRVDMRLRPFGSEGALVCSIDALENYYQSYGREWERYAWIKGRVVVGDGKQVERLLKPFVFRKYLDFGALESMRDLKKQIQSDVILRDLHDNIKLGRGGIREIEFIVQVFQLMRGGQEGMLQVKPTLKAMQNLVKLGLLDKSVKDALTESYQFLRNLEHRLQYYNDAQTHDLPKNDTHRAIIARSMQMENWGALLTVTNHHRDFVKAQFDAVFASEEVTESDQTVIDIWSGLSSEAELHFKLVAMGYEDESDALSKIIAFKKSARYKHLPELSKQRLDVVMPIIIELAGKYPNPNETLQRTINLVETVCRRASYLAFFTEYPQVLNRLLSLVSASPWIASYLSQHPVLLDSLTDNVNTYQIDDAVLEAQLLEKMQWLDGDVEQQMNALREFQQQQLFAIASKDIYHQISLEALSSALSALADMILRVVLKTVWPLIKDRHCETPKFAVIAYGKHGGRELGYSSDLDLVFLYQDDHPEARDIYSRYGMRIISWLNNMTSSGILYETDMQLRPDGNSGLLVISVESFEKYQFEKAWVWEHQAMTRARFAVGDEIVGNAFEQVRKKVLKMPRNIQTLKADVLDMRERMKSAYRYVEGRFNLKKSLGGMIDIEFIVQYLILANAHQHASLLENSGNIKILSTCASLGLIPQSLAEQACEAYLVLRKQQHAMRLQGFTEGVVPESKMLNTMQAVRALWQYVFVDH